MELSKDTEKKMEVIRATGQLSEGKIEKTVKSLKAENVYMINAMSSGKAKTAYENVKKIVEGEDRTGEESVRNILETLGTAGAIEYMNEFSGKKRDITEKDIFNLSKLLSGKILEAVKADRYREDLIIPFGGRGYTHPEDIKRDMKDFIEFGIKERGKYHPVVFAAKAHKRIAEIQPFNDNVEKLAMVIMNGYLLQDKYLPVTVTASNLKEYKEVLKKDSDGPFVDFIKGLETKRINDFYERIVKERETEKTKETGKKKDIKGEEVKKEKRKGAGR